MESILLEGSTIYSNFCSSALYYRNISDQIRAKVQGSGEVRCTAKVCIIRFASLRWVGFPMPNHARNVFPKRSN